MSSPSIKSCIFLDIAHRSRKSSIPHADPFTCRSCGRTSSGPWPCPPARPVAPAAATRTTRTPSTSSASPSPRPPTRTSPPSSPRPHEGEGVKFQTSYGPSGDQSRAVAAGLKADYVHFSVPTDVTRLVDEGLVADDWDAGENKGVVSTLGRRLRRPRRQPQEHQDLGRPGQARRRDRHAQPRLLGRRALERPRRLRPGHQRRWHRGGGHRVRQQVLQERRLAAEQRSRRHHRLPRRHR